MKKLILISLLLIFTACKKSNSKKDESLTVNLVINKDSINEFKVLPKKIKAEEVYNKVFYAITKTDSVDIVYHYCDASVNTIKVYKDSIWEDFGQEDYTMLVGKTDINDKELYFLGKQEQTTPVKKYSFSIENSDKGYWKINDKTYIDSLKIDKIKQYRQPDKDCWEDEIP